MDEALELKTAATIGDRRDFGERQLSCKNDARKTDVLQREDAFEVMGDKLSRGVERERREVTTAKTRDARDPGR